MTLTYFRANIWETIKATATLSCSHTARNALTG